MVLTPTRLPEGTPLQRVTFAYVGYTAAPHRAHTWSTIAFSRNKGCAGGERDAAEAMTARIAGATACLHLAAVGEEAPAPLFNSLLAEIKAQIEVHKSLVAANDKQKKIQAAAARRPLHKYSNAARPAKSGREVLYKHSLAAGADADAVALRKAEEEAWKAFQEADWRAALRHAVARFNVRMPDLERYLLETAFYPGLPHLHKSATGPVAALPPVIVFLADSLRSRYAPEIMEGLQALADKDTSTTSLRLVDVRLDRELLLNDVRAVAVHADLPAQFKSAGDRIKAARNVEFKEATAAVQADLDAAKKAFDEGDSGDMAPMTDALREYISNPAPHFAAARDAEYLLQPKVTPEEVALAQAQYEHLETGEKLEVSDALQQRVKNPPRGFAKEAKALGYLLRPKVSPATRAVQGKGAGDFLQFFFLGVAGEEKNFGDMWDAANWVCEQTMVTTAFADERAAQNSIQSTVFRGCMLTLLAVEGGLLAATKPPRVNGTKHALTPAQGALLGAFALKTLEDMAGGEAPKRVTEADGEAPKRVTDATETALKNLRSGAVLALARKAKGATTNPFTDAERVALRKAVVAALEPITVEALEVAPEAKMSTRKSLDAIMIRVVAMTLLGEGLDFSLAALEEKKDGGGEVAVAAVLETKELAVTNPPPAKMGSRECNQDDGGQPPAAEALLGDASVSDAAKEVMRACRARPQVLEALDARMSQARMTAADRAQVYKYVMLHRGIENYTPEVAETTTKRPVRVVKRVVTRDIPVTVVPEWAKNNEKAGCPGATGKPALKTAATKVMEGNPAARALKPCFFSQAFTVDRALVSARGFIEAKSVPAAKRVEYWHQVYTFLALFDQEGRPLPAAPETTTEKVKQTAYGFEDEQVKTLQVVVIPEPFKGLLTTQFVCKPKAEADKATFDAVLEEFMWEKDSGGNPVYDLDQEGNYTQFMTDPETGVDTDTPKPKVSKVGTLYSACKRLPWNGNNVLQRGQDRQFTVRDQARMLVLLAAAQGIPDATEDTFLSTTSETVTVWVPVTAPALHPKETREVLNFPADWDENTTTVTGPLGPDLSAAKEALQAMIPVKGADYALLKKFTLGIGARANLMQTVTTLQSAGLSQDGQVALYKFSARAHGVKEPKLTHETETFQDPTLYVRAKTDM